MVESWEVQVHPRELGGTEFGGISTRQRVWRKVHMSESWELRLHVSELKSCVHGRELRGKLQGRAIEGKGTCQSWKVLIHGRIETMGAWQKSCERGRETRYKAKMPGFVREEYKAGSCWMGGGYEERHMTITRILDAWGGTRYSTYNTSNTFNTSSSGAK